eukprot:COSAG01_NODE_434_length_17079_cov_11.829270_2_plen_356_part_00
MAHNEVATASCWLMPTAVPRAAVMTMPPPIPKAPLAKPVSTPVGIKMCAFAHAACTPQEPMMSAPTCHRPVVPSYLAIWFRRLWGHTKGVAAVDCQKWRRLRKVTAKRRTCTSSRCRRISGVQSGTGPSGPTSMLFSPALLAAATDADTSPCLFFLPPKKSTTGTMQMMTTPITLASRCEGKECAKAPPACVKSTEKDTSRPAAGRLATLRKTTTPHVSSPPHPTPPCAPVVLYSRRLHAPLREVGGCPHAASHRPSQQCGAVNVVLRHACELLEGGDDHQPSTNPRKRAQHTRQQPRRHCDGQRYGRLRRGAEAAGEEPLRPARPIAPARAQGIAAVLYQPLAAVLSRAMMAQC